MIASEAREWVELITGRAGALVVLLGVAAVLVYWIEGELTRMAAYQQAQIETLRDQSQTMLEGQALMAENQKVLREILEVQRDQYTATRRLLFQNVDSPKQP